MRATAMRVGVIGAILLGVLAPMHPAQAVAPTALTWQDPAPRASGDGLAATSVPLKPRTPVRMPDGDLVVVDTETGTMRAVDSQTGVISRVAGNGTRLSSCTAPAAVDVTTIGLPVTGFVGADSDGDIYVMGGNPSQPWTCYADPVLRLDHVDRTWHVVVRNRVADRASVGYGSYSAMAVAPDGTVYVTDRVAHVVRAYAPGADPEGPGVVVAGVAGASGLSGDGGPATAATINEPRLAASNAAVFLVDPDYNGFGDVVRRVALSTGTITRVAGSGARAAYAPGPDPSLGLPGPSAALSINSFALDASGTTVFLAQNRGSDGDLDAVAVGGVLRSVATGVTCGWDLLAPTVASGELLATCTSEVRGWPADGSDAAGDGTLRAGLDSTTGNGTSPDGVPLSVLRPGELVDMAVSPAGVVALAGPGGVRTVAAIASNAPVTLVSAAAATSVAWGTDGALFWIEKAGSGAVVRRLAPAGGTITRLLGGGASPMAAGASGTSVTLPTGDDLALDVADRRLIVLAGTGDANPSRLDHRYNQVWSLDLVSGVLSLLAGNGTAGTPVDGAAALDAPLGEVSWISWDTASDVLTASTAYEAVRISAGVVRAPVTVTSVLDATPGPAGRVVGRRTVLAADGTLSSFTPPEGTMLTASAPNGSLVAAVPSGPGGLLRTSNVLDPVVALDHPAASVTAVPGEGQITITVTPPAKAGLEVITTISDLDYPSGATGVLTFTTTGSTAPRVVVVHRSQSPGESQKPARILTVTYADNYGRQAVRAVVTTAGPDVTAPPPVTELSFTEGANPTDQMVMRLPDVDDLSYVRACVVQGSTPPATVSNCSAGSQLEYVTYPLGDRLFIVSLPLGDDIDRAQPRTYSVFLVDRAGNASRVDAYRGPGVAAPVAADIIRGINWHSTADGSAVTFSMRGDPDSAAIVEGTTPPAPVMPNGGIHTARTWTVTGLTAGHTYTARFFVWSDDRSTFTPTDVRVVAGTSSRDVVTVTASSSVDWGRNLAVSATVARAVSGSTSRSVQAGVPVELWKRVAPSATWVKAGTGTTDASGRASWTLSAVGATTSLQARVPGQGSVYPAIEVSAATTTTVRPRVTGSLAASNTVTVKKVKRGKSVTFSITALPKRVSTVQVQRLVSGAWKTVATRTTSTTGKAAWSMKTKKKGSIRLRAVVVASAALASGTSQTVTVKVV